MLQSMPKGVETLLSLAAACESLAQELMRRRAELADAVGIYLNRSERALLGAIPEAQLRAMIETIRPGLREPERRRFLRQATAALLLMAIGGSAPACEKGTQPLCPFRPSGPTMGIRPGHSMFMGGEPDYTTPKGAKLDWPVSTNQIQLYVGFIDVRDRALMLDVHRAVVAKGPEICACYLMSAPTPNPEGAAATLTLRIARDGTVEDVSVYVEEYPINQSTFGDHTSVTCLANTFRALRIAPSDKAARVRFTIVLGFAGDPELPKLLEKSRLR